MEHSIRLSITVKPELKKVADEIAKENKITRSKLISQCLEELSHKRKEELLIKYYKAMAKEHRNFAKQSAGVIQNIAASWRD